MDERKRLPRQLKKGLLLLGCVLAAGVLLYAASIYRQTQSIIDPKGCFTTNWNKVTLCATDPQYVHYKQIPNLLIRTLLISEDASFFSHQGMDWYEIKESIKRNWQERRYVRGGSTISQQLAKNLYLNQEKSLRRKLKEFFITQKIEKLLTKEEILEKYLNVIEFGENLFGLYEASHFYFKKHPSQLNLLEGVFLVSIIPNPKVYASGFKQRKLSPLNVQKMNIILKRLYHAQRISEKELVYSQTLLETETWPFNFFSPQHFDYMEIPDVQSELEVEIQDMQPTSEENVSEESSLHNSTQEPSAEELDPNTEILETD